MTIRLVGNYLVSGDHGLSVDQEVGYDHGVGGDHGVDGVTKYHFQLLSILTLSNGQHSMVNGIHIEQKHNTLKLMISLLHRTLNDHLVIS